MTMVNPAYTNLVSWWSLNETSGNRADSYGSNTLTDTNTVLYAAGKQGNAADFEKDNSKTLRIADNAALSLVGSVTVAGWINIESLPATRTGIITKVNGITTTSGYGLSLETVSGSTYLHFHIGGNGTYVNVTLGTALSTGTWYFVYGIWNDATDTATVGLDAVTPQSAGSGPTTLADNAFPFVLGNTMTGGTYYDGLIDEVCVYSGALSSDNIEWLYNGGSGRTYASLAGQSIAPFLNSYRTRRI